MNFNLFSIETFINSALFITMTVASVFVKLECFFVGYDEETNAMEYLCNSTHS